MSAAMVFLPAAAAPFWLGYWLGRPEQASSSVDRTQLAVGAALAALPLALRLHRRGARTYVQLKQFARMKALTQSLYSANNAGGMHGLKLQRFRNMCLLAGAASLGLGVASSALIDARDSPKELRKPLATSVVGRAVAVAMALPTLYAVVYTPLTMLPAMGVAYGTKYVAGK